MSSFLQLKTFFISFIFGILFYFFTNINFNLIKNLKIIYQHILTFLYVMDVVIIYVILIYKINNGYFHIYFIFMVIIGFLFSSILLKKIFSKIHVKTFFSN